MQYDVLVDTAARFITPLYEALGAGHPLGERRPGMSDPRRRVEMMRRRRET
jgi:hypothetical protein